MKYKTTAIMSLLSSLGKKEKKNLDHCWSYWPAKENQLGQVYCLRGHVQNSKYKTMI